MDRIDAANELAFRVGFTGHSGHLSIEPLPPVYRPRPVDSLPEFILVMLLDSILLHYMYLFACELVQSLCFLYFLNFNLKFLHMKCILVICS